MKTQQRAICPCCFNDQAIKGTTMVSHGYTRPYDYSGNVGNCGGAYAHHFGTLEGKAVAARTAEQLREYAAKQLTKAAQIANGTLQSIDKNGQVIETTQYQRDNAARRIAYNATLANRDAEGIEAKVAAWTPAQPVEIEVARAVVLTHYYQKGFGKACAVSRMGAQKGNQTSAAENVNCPKCLKILEKG